MLILFKNNLGKVSDYMKSNFMHELKIVLKVAWKEYLFKLFTSLVIRGILLVIPVLFSFIVNDVTHQNFDNAFAVLVLLFILVLVYRIFEGINQIAYYKLYTKLYSFYNVLALKKTEQNSLFSLSRFTSSSFSNIVITDVDIISGFFSSLVIRIIQIVEFVVIYIYFLNLDIYLFASCAVISIVMIFISIFSGNKVQDLNEKRKQNLDVMGASMFDFFAGIKEVKSYHLFDRISSLTSSNVNKYLKAHSRYNVKFNFNNHMFLYVFEAARLLSVLYGIYLIRNGNFEVGTLLIIWNYYQKIIDNFSTILTINVEYRNIKVSLNRFYKLAEHSNSKVKGPEIDKNSVKGRIEFKNILYGFKDNPTLKDASIVLKENAITVLTGRDEAAQAGIFELILKLNKQHEGTITLDGMDINEIDEDSYYRLVSTEGRQSVFFDIPIKENLLLVNEDENKIMEICKKTGLDEQLMKLPKGYDTIISTNTPISQSTKKLLVLVRLLLQESKVLLIDDIINNLDKEHENKILKMFEEMKKDHTIVIISNSKEIIEKADYIYEVNNKTIKKEK